MAQTFLGVIASEETDWKLAEHIWTPPRRRIADEFLQVAQTYNQTIHCQFHMVSFDEQGIPLYGPPFAVDTGSVSSHPWYSMCFCGGFYLLPSVKFTELVEMAVYSGFSHEKWWIFPYLFEITGGDPLWISTWLWRIVRVSMVFECFWWFLRSAAASFLRHGWSHLGRPGIQRNIAWCWSGLMGSRLTTWTFCRRGFCLGLCAFYFWWWLKLVKLIPLLKIRLHTLLNMI